MPYLHYKQSRTIIIITIYYYYKLSTDVLKNKRKHLFTSHQLQLIMIDLINSTNFPFLSLSSSLEFS